jgi:hypothetical protein
MRNGNTRFSEFGLATADRDPNLAAATLAVGGAVLALWQTVNNFLGRKLWPNSIVIAILVYLDIFLFFESL